MRTSQKWILLFMLIAAFNNPGCDSFLFRRRRSPPPPPPRCVCTQHIPTVNNNPLGISGVNVCTYPHTQHETHCYNCECGQCPRGVTQTYHILRCCDGWQQSGPTCTVGIPCSGPPAIANGDINPVKSFYGVGEVVSYSCRVHFQLSGGSQMTCILGPRWSVGPPQCTPIPCSQPVLQPNTRIIQGWQHSYEVGKRIELGCEPNFGHASGQPFLICQMGLSWSGETFVCKPICFGQLNRCNNGGQCVRPDFCEGCHEGYHSPKCDLCPKVVNCDFSICQYPDIQGSLRCKKCSFDYTPSGPRAYDISPDGKSCLKRCSWRSDSNVCYPGQCGWVETCQCAPGFTSVSTQCSIIEERPKIQPNIIRLYYGGIHKGEHSYLDMNSAEIVFSNAQSIDSIELDVVASYFRDVPPRPVYVERNVLGLKKFTFDIYYIKFDAVKQEEQKLVVSRDNPSLVKDVTWEKSYALRKTQPLAHVCGNVACLLSHGERIEFTVFVENGGFIDVKQWDSGSLTRRPFTGKAIQHQFKIQFDQEKPVHCSQLGYTCADPQPLKLSDYLLDSKKSVTIQWAGWTDQMSGISKTTIEISEMANNGQQLTEGSHMPESYHREIDVPITETQTQIFLPNEKTAVYQIKLTVCDKVVEKRANCAYARRFVLVDAQTSVTNDLTQFPITIHGIYQNHDGQLWWNQEVNQIVVNWTDHFTNAIHQKRGVLKAISPWPYAGEDPFYDHKQGVRSIHPILNAKGITHFQYSLNVASDPFIWTDMSPSATTVKTMTINLIDGTVHQIGIQAFDVMKHSLISQITFNVDSSPPILQNISLIVDGHEEVKVHNSKELYKMTVRFHVKDPHSGISSIKWDLFDNFTQEELLLGEDETDNQRYSSFDECIRSKPPASCYCTLVNLCYSSIHIINPSKDSSLKENRSLAEHDYDLFFRIRVQNNAGLTSEKVIKITIDTSGPVPGSVIDGLDGEPEVEYQASLIVNGYWRGFVDPESGIYYYLYRFGTKCYTQMDMADRGVTQQTLLTSVQTTVASPGRYHLTVVAVNFAFSVSPPVCSKGVLIDTTPPILSSLVIDHILGRPGMVKEHHMDSAKSLWWIDEQRRRHRINLNNISEDCLNMAQNSEMSSEDIVLFPPYTLTNGQIDTINLPNVWCQQHRHVNFTNILVFNGHEELRLSVNASDSESHIRSLSVALIPETVPNLTVYLDSVIWYPCESLLDCRIQDVALFLGSVFYLHIRAVNYAQLSSIKQIGPVTLDTTPPQSVKDIQRVTITKRGTVEAFWEEPLFVDYEEPLELSYSVGMGTLEGRDDLIKYTSVFSRCAEIFTENTSLTCIGIPLPHNVTLLRKQLYLSIKSINTAGLTSITSKLLNTHGGPNLQHIVISIIDQHGNENYYLPTNQTFKIRVGNFKWTPDISKVELKIVTIDDEDELKRLKFFTNVTEAQTEYELQTNDLPFFQKYKAVFYLQFVDFTTLNFHSHPFAIYPQYMEHNILMENILDCDQKCNPSSSFDYQLSLSSLRFRYALSNSSRRELRHVTHTQLTLYHFHSHNKSTEALQRTLKHMEYDNDNSINMKFYVHSFVGMQLLEGNVYQVSVALCYGSVCSMEHFSRPIVIINPHPIPGEFTHNVSIEEKSVHYSLKRSFFTGLSMSQSINLIKNYEWCLAFPNMFILTNWTLLEMGDENDQQILGSFPIPSTIHMDRCIHIFVRISSIFGFSSTASAELLPCVSIRGVKTMRQNILIDAKGPIKLRRNEPWLETDFDFSLPSERLAAVWPTLRHGNYHWSLLMDFSWSFSNPNFFDFCLHPQAIACGVVSGQEYINAPDNLTLQSGHHYRFCIHANEEIKRFERFREHLAEVLTCSDGVLVVGNPPIPGQIIFTDTNSGEIRYSAESSSVTVQWKGFQDDIITLWHPLQYGIRKFYLSIGSSPGSSDIYENELGGSLTREFISNVKMISGHKYYATLSAQNFVGLRTTVHSRSLTIDNQPPQSRPNANIRIAENEGVLNSLTSVTIDWSWIFEDLQTGIAYYTWCISTNGKYCDISGSLKTSNDILVTDLPSLQNGRKYYVIVQAFDLLGHSMSKTSSAFRFSSSPPQPQGGLHFTSLQTSAVELHYISTTIEGFCLKWNAFIDGYSDLYGYSVQIGSCEGCDDVVHQLDTGLNTEAIFRHVSLHGGQRLFASVKGCNEMKLCSSTSVGPVLVDATPPVLGKVLHGNTISHEPYTSKRNFITARLLGFMDTESGISMVQWCVGSQKNNCDIFTKQTQIGSVGHLHKVLPNNQLFKENRWMFVNVEVFNHAGLSVKGSSERFQVVSSFPTFLMEPTFDLQYGSIDHVTQVFTNSLQVSWNVTDEQCQISRQTLRIFSHEKGDSPLRNFQLDGMVRRRRITGLQLRDGFKYVASVTSCNQANLCSTKYSQPLLVDSSPPTVGQWLVPTGRSSSKPQDEINIPVWNATGIYNLRWTSFQDVHSGVSHYFIRLGWKYALADLGQVTIRQEKQNDEVQNAAVPFNKEYRGISQQILYISIQAVNKVGLFSHIMQAAFRLKEDGTAELQRRCQASTCVGHCTCAAWHKNCLPVKNCQSPTAFGKPLMSYQVFNRLELASFNISIGELNPNFTPELCTLMAEWRSVETTMENKAPAKWFEVSAGLASHDMPTGLFNALQGPIWFAVGQKQKAVLRFPLEKAGECMRSGIRYKIFVRAWYSEDVFMVYSSSGIEPLIQTPTVVRKSGVAIEEWLSTTVQSVGFLNHSIPELTLKWSYKFVQHNAAPISHFTISIGSTSLVDDILEATSLSGTESSFQWKNEVSHKFLTGKRYFTRVEACNVLLLCSSAISRGFVFDATAPTGGYIMASRDGLRSISHVRPDDSIFVSWGGFYDPESYVTEYFFGWSTNDVSSDESVNYVNMGLNMRTHLHLKGLSISVDSEELLLHVYAINGARISSKCITLSIRIARTPSYIQSSCSVELNDTTPLLPIDEFITITTDELFQQRSTWWKQAIADRSQTLLPGWSLDNNESSAVLGAMLNDPSQSAQIILIHGLITLSTVLEMDMYYRLDFQVADFSTNRHDTRSVLFGTDDDTQVHSIFSSNDIRSLRWVTFTRYLAARNESTLLRIKFGSQQQDEFGLAFRRISLTPCDIRLNYSSVPSFTSIPSVSTSESSGQTIVELGFSAGDDESLLTEVHVAMGSMAGGIQIQSYERQMPLSLNHDYHFRSKPLYLPHGTPIHLTILLKNSAENLRMIHVPPLDSVQVAPKVDLTPPHLQIFWQSYTGNMNYCDNSPCYFLRSRNAGQSDESNLSRLHIVSKEEESELGDCYLSWSTLSQLDADDLSPFSAIRSEEEEQFPSGLFYRNFSVDTSDFLNKVSPAISTVYPNVKCYNIQGRSSIKNFQMGLILLDESSDMKMALKLIKPSRFHYSSKEDVLSHQLPVILSQSSQQHTAYKYQYQNASSHWLTIGNSFVNHFALPEDKCQPTEAFQDLLNCHINLRSVDPLSDIRESTAKEYLRVLNPPKITNYPPLAMWNGSSLTLSWNVTFFYSLPLVYEVTFGQKLGKSDLLKVLQTRSASVALRNVSLTASYGMTLTAVGEDGSSISANYIIQGRNVTHMI